MKNWNNKLYDLRIDNEKTQKEIANYLGISQQYYSQYEKGKNELPIRHLIKICIYYQVSADYILGLPKGLKNP